MLKRMGWVLLLMIEATQAFAGDAFSTGWGRALNTSPVGMLFFVFLEVLGIWTCLKSLRLLYQFYNHKQNKYGWWTCLTIFFTGCLLYFSHGTINVIYNSF
jgi:hypothetical protein